MTAFDKESDKYKQIEAIVNKLHSEYFDLVRRETEINNEIKGS